MDLAGYRPTLNEVAALFGKSSRWISDLRAKGEMPEDGATAKEFVAAWTSLAAAGGGKKSIEQHKSRLAAAKADQAEMDLAEARKELLPRPLVTHAVQGAFARVRAKLLALPAKSAPAIAAMKSAVTIQEKMTELVHEALAELARTDVDVTGEAAPGDEPGAGGGGAGLVAGVHAAASPDGEPVGGPAPDAEPRGQRRTRKVGHKPR